LVAFAPRFSLVAIFSGKLGLFQQRLCCVFGEVGRIPVFRQQTPDVPAQVRPDRPPRIQSSRDIGLTTCESSRRN
jgi:hypothetical protein